ncbi:MAG: hypothetical protein HZB57_00275 [Gammaproteobacteria bacterium]|nr:hypothetical protein [Gammaproteobacteria bacterium]
MNKNLLVIGVMAVLGTGGMSVQAAVLNTGDLLSISAGIYDIDTGFVIAGSWMGGDANGNAVISSSEKVAVYPGTDGGVVMGMTQSPGEIDDWSYYSVAGGDYTTIAPTGGTTAGIDFTGWTVAWSSIPAINMGGGAWGAGYSNGVANFSWSGTYGDAYTLDYHATVPFNDPSGFGGVRFAWHLTGNVVAGSSSVPVPGAVWLFGSGLLGLMAAVKRKSV